MQLLKAAVLGFGQATRPHRQSDKAQDRAQVPGTGAASRPPQHCDESGRQGGLVRGGQAQHHAGHRGGRTDRGL